uniref:Concanavalin-A n=1 Tax=Lygus hesperus TaxID=30085 RepID=A0A0A9YRU0_LYGHE
MGVNRMAGNALGCALGYLAHHNTQSYTQMIACVMSFVFVCQCCKNHPLYGQTFFYASVMCMAGVATSVYPMQLLTRVLASTYTIVSYMLCCMLIFPTNGIKVL